MTDREVSSLIFGLKGLIRMNLKEMKEVLQLMADHGLTEFELEKDGLKVKLRKGPGNVIQQEVVSVQPGAAPAAPAGSAPAAPAAAAAPQPVADAANVHVVKSPMVGTFYSSPAPEQPAYVTAGKKVQEGDVLCIVEAMKLMNEIKAEASGTVAEVLAKNGQPVEFDQPLFKITKG